MRRIPLAFLALLCGGCTANVADRTSSPSSSPSLSPLASPAAPGVAAPVRRGASVPRPPSRTPTPRGPRPAVVDIPAIGVHRVRVVPYRGTPDDAAGTRIQNRGELASPFGPGASTAGPGDVGNYVITGHRTAHGAPLRRLPELVNGDAVRVTSGGTVYEYAVRGTMRISFRSTASLARQAAPVPGAPGRVATRAYLTLSTCATPEDHAAGDWWHDALGNPEHRIDKVAVLVRTSRA